MLFTACLREAGEAGLADAGNGEPIGVPEKR
jgi:hypothetical protein